MCVEISDMAGSAITAPDGIQSDKPRPGGTVGADVLGDSGFRVKTDQNFALDFSFPLEASRGTEENIRFEKRDLC